MAGTRRGDLRTCNLYPLTDSYIEPTMSEIEELRAERRELLLRLGTATGIASGCSTQMKRAAISIADKPVRDFIEKVAELLDEAAAIVPPSMDPEPLARGTDGEVSCVR